MRPFLHDLPKLAEVCGAGLGVTIRRVVLGKPSAVLPPGQLSPVAPEDCAVGDDLRRVDFVGFFFGSLAGSWAGSTFGSI